MFYSQDGKVKAQKWPDFQEKVMKKYGKAGEDGKILLVKYDEVDRSGDVVRSGAICVDSDCPCQGNW